MDINGEALGTVLTEAHEDVIDKGKGDEMTDGEAKVCEMKLPA